MPLISKLKLVLGKNIEFVFRRGSVLMKWKRHRPTIYESIKVLKKPFNPSRTPLAFQFIKNAITTAPTFSKPDFVRDFQIYINDTKLVVSAILVQLDTKKFQRLVAFMSQSFTKYEFKHSLIKKKALSLMIALRKFRHYVLGKHTIVKVSLPVVKYLTSQTFLQEKMANWLTISKHTKFRNLWLGAFTFAQNSGNNAFQLKDSQERLFSHMVNVSVLKPYLSAKVT